MGRQLLDFLKRNNNTRKIFGERELKIIEKQLLGINLTQSEKNRLSRDIRKKLKFIKEISRFSEDFELKKSSITKEIINNAKEIILDDTLFNKIKRIILYGSILENTLNFQSDIDITVDFSKIDTKEATLFRKRISGQVNSRIDIQVYNILPNKIKNEVDKKGKVIWKQE